MLHDYFKSLTLLLLFFAASAQAQPATPPTTQPPPPSPIERTDLLDMAEGAVVLSKSSEYGGSQWSALALLDGTSSLGWCSRQSAPFPHEVLIEIARPSSIEAIAFDQTQAQESGYAGISAKDVEVWASNVSPTDGFSKVLQVQLPKGGKQEVRLPTPTAARWLKFVVRSNWGHAEYTEMMELAAYGTPLPGPVTQAPLSGVYSTNYNLIRFDQSGNSVKGCYDHAGGTLSGTTNGRVVQFEWREDQGTDVGTALMILSAQGDLINGFWYRGGSLAGNWTGERAKPGQEPTCQVDVKKSAIATNIAQTGKAITYGILFDTASDRIKPESEATLTEVLNLLNAQPTLNLEIGGHTDAQGGDAYNTDLSQRRARSVVAWLTAKGITTARLTAAGYGKSQPVSDNATPQGRALNRRVELVKK